VKVEVPAFKNNYE